MYPCHCALQPHTHGGIGCFRLPFRVFPRITYSPYLNAPCTYIPHRIPCIHNYHAAAAIRTGTRLARLSIRTKESDASRTIFPSPVHDPGQSTHFITKVPTGRVFFHFIFQRIFGLGEGVIHHTRHVCEFTLSTKDTPDSPPLQLGTVFSTQTLFWRYPSRRLSIDFSPTPSLS